MSKNYISPSLLPMNEIAQYLETVAKFGKKTDSSIDTQNVAQVDSKLIARAAINDNGTLYSDRDTVKNALHLGGVPANNYITTEGAGALLADTYAVSTNAGNEIKSLRDELYQIKSELAKAGLLKTLECYNGYVDPFKIGNEKYLYEAITIVNTDMGATSNSYIAVEDTSKFIAGEYIVIDTTEPQIVKIQNIPHHGRLNLESNVSAIPHGTKVYKSYGSYSNSSFVFGQQKGLSVSSKEKYIILNDDAQPLILTKQYTPNSGYASQINIPSTAKGAIRRVGVQARVNGNPGGLRCYIIDPANNTTDVTTLPTIEALRTDGKIIGESNLLHASSATGSYNELYFEFNNPVILDKSNYIFLFVQIDANQYNYWELKGLRGESSMDLQTNSKLYSFSEGAGLRIEDGDLYLVVVTSDVLLNQINYNKRGLYSCEFKLADLTTATRVRVELKINREGRFKVVDNPTTLIPNASSPLMTINEDNKTYPNLFNTGDIVIIGDHIGEVGSSRNTNNSFTLKQDTYAPAGADVYRMGYKVQVKASNVSINKQDSANPLKVENVVLIPLSLVAVVPGKEAGKESISSDRLVFEAEIQLDNHTNYKLNSFNNIEVQVY